MSTAFRFTARNSRSALLQKTALVGGVLAAMLLTGAAPASAQSTWTGATPDWNTAGNWNPAGVPAGGDVAQFLPNGAVISVSTSANTQIGEIDFLAGAAGFTITLGDDLTVNNAAGVVNSSGANQTIRTGAGGQTIFLNGPTGALVTYDLTAGGTIQLRSGSIGGDSAYELGAGGLLALVGAASTVTIGSLSSTTGAVSNNNGAPATLIIGTLGTSTTFGGTFSQAAGSISIEKVGAGTLTLTGANAYTGTTTISAGTLQIDNGGITGTLGTGNVVNNGVLAFNRGAGATLNVLNVISGTGSLTKLGAGTVALLGANTYSDTTTISAGTLQIGNGGTTGTLGTGNVVDNGVLAFNRGAGATLNVSNAISGTGSLTKLGIGTVALLGGSSYSGLTTISAGTLSVGGGMGVTASQNLGDDSATNGVVLDGGRLNVTSVAAETFARPVSVTASGGEIANVASLTLTTGVTFTGLLSKSGAGTLVLNGAGTGAGGLSVLAGGLQIGNASALGTGTLRMAGNTSLIASPSNVSVANAVILDGSVSVVTNNNTLSLTGAISGVGRLDKNNGGTLNLSGANSFAGGFGLNAGTLGVGSNTAVGTGQINVATATTLQALGNVTLANAIRFNASAGFGTANAVFDTGANTLTLNGVISGAAVGIEQTPYGLTKTGTGTLVLNGANTYTGATVVNAGKLVVGADGTTGATIASSSSLTIAAGATIGGNGATPTLTVNGTISPGNSVGTLNINGGLILGASSTTVIEIEGATSDRINVTGTAALNGTLQLVAAGGTYSFATPYTILTATGARTGTFATVNTTGSFGVGVTSAVAYGANNVQVTLTAAPLVVAPTPTPATPAAPVTPVVTATAPVFGLTQTRNITAVAYGLDRAVAGGANVSSLFAVYNQPTRAALAAAVNTLSGEIHTATSAIGYRASDQFLRVMLDPYAIGRDGRMLGGGASDFTADLPSRRGPVPAPTLRIEPSYNVWAAVFGATGTTNGDATVVGSAKRELKDVNVAVGADVRVAPGTVAGFALSGGQSNARLSGGLGTAEADIFQAGLYGATQLGALRLGASASYGSMQVQTRRSIPALGQNPIADYRADVLGGRLQAAYEVFSSGGFSVSPFAALQIQSVHLPNFRETNSLTGVGAGVNGLSRTNTAFRSELGVKAASVTQIGGRRLTLFTELGWGHDFLRDMTFGATLVGVPSASFVIAGARQDRDVGLFAAGVDYQISPNLVLGGRFDGTASANSRTYAGTASLRMSF